MPLEDYPGQCGEPDQQQYVPAKPLNFRQSNASEVTGILGVFAWSVLCLIVGVSVVVACDVLLMHGIQEVAYWASKLPPL